MLLQDDRTTLGWIRHNDYDRSAKTRLLLEESIKALKTGKKPKTEFPPPKVKSESIKIPVPVAGNYRVEFMATLSGKSMGIANVSTASTSLQIRIPAFTGDIAFKIRRGDA